jgi:hypothetical protein
MSRDLDSIINEAFSALAEAQSEGEKLVLMLPKFTPTEAWGDPKSMDRQQVNKIFRSISSGASIQARIDGINKFLTPESAAKKTSVNSIINHLIIVESLRACVKNFGASSAGFVFEAFIAALTSGSQQSDKVGGTLPIEDIVAFSTVSGKSAPLSLKLLSGSTQVKGSYTNLIDYLFFRNSEPGASVGYLVAYKDSATDVSSIRLELFYINRENLPEFIRQSTKGGDALMSTEKESEYKKALASGDYEEAGKVLIGTKGYSPDGAGNKKKKDNTDPGSLGEFHEREKASMSLISEGKGGLQFSITQDRIAKLNTHEKLGTLNFGDENFYKIATICSEKVGDKVKNVLGSVKNMTNNINGYFTEKSRSQAISNGSEAINDAKQLTTSLQSDMQDRPTNESKEPAEQQEEVINYNVLMEMIGKEAKQAFQEEVIEEATFSSFNFPYDGNEKFSGAGSRTQYAQKDQSYPTSKETLIFDKEEMKASKLPAGTMVKFLKPWQLYKGKDLGLQGRAANATLAAVSHAGGEGYVSVRSVEKPSGKTQARVSSGSLAQDTVMSILAAEASGKGIEVKKISSAPPASTKPDLVVDYGGTEIQFEIKGRKSNRGFVTVFDKSMRRGGATPPVLQAVIDAYISTLVVDHELDGEKRTSSLKAALSSVGLPETFEGIIDFYQKYVSSSIGYCSDRGDVPKSGKLPSALTTTDSRVLSAMKKEIVGHLLESGDEYFAIYTDSSKSVDIYSTGGKDPLKANPVPDFKSVKLATYGGCSSGATRVGFKIQLEDIDSNLPDKVE